MVFEVTKCDAGWNGIVAQQHQYGNEPPPAQAMSK